MLHTYQTTFSISCGVLFFQSAKVIIDILLSMLLGILRERESELLNWNMYLALRFSTQAIGNSLNAVGHLDGYSFCWRNVTVSHGYAMAS